MSKKNDTLAWILIAAGVAAIVIGTKKVIDDSWKSAANADKYIPIANAAEAQYGIPQDLIARMAYQESHFRDDIVYGQTPSSAGALGIMQIVPKFHPDISIPDILNPATAIPYAARYVKQLYSQFGDWDLAVAAYNAGPGNVGEYGGIPPFAETQNYVAQIFGDLGLASPNSAPAQDATS